MLAAPVLPLPPGTPPPHHRHSDSHSHSHSNSHYEQTYSYRNTPSPPISPPPPPEPDTLFLHRPKSRPCRSAPSPPITKLEDFDCSSSSSSSSCSSASSSVSSSSPSVSTSSTSKLHKKDESDSSSSSCKCSCFCACSSIASFFFGHCPAFTAWSTSFASRSRAVYLSLFFLESSLRSIGDVTFCSNPFSGLIIFVAMFLSAPHAAFIGFLVLTMGIETAVVFLRVPMEEVRCGVVTFNNFLIGCVMALMASPDVILSNPDIIVMAIVVGFLAQVIWKGLNGILAPQFEFPLLNAPFHVMMFLYLYSGLAGWYHPESHDAPSSPHSNSDFNMTSPLFTPLEIDQDMTFVEPLDWRKLFLGVLLAPGQVFGTNTLITSSMVHFAVFIYSPIMLLECLTGSLIGTLIGALLVEPADYGNLYDGSWGYNPLFTTAAIGGFLVVFNFSCWLLSLTSAVITTLVYATMLKCHVPAMGVPFMTVTWLLLPAISPAILKRNQCPASSSCGDVSVQIDDEDSIAQEMVSGPFIRLRLCQITTPELHRQLYLPKKRKVFAEKSRKSRKKIVDGKGEDLVSSLKNGVMNKYKSSISEANLEPGEIPPELSNGVERHSILPL